MKPILYVFALVFLISTSSFSQTEKGSMFSGPGLNAWFTATSYESSSIKTTSGGSVLSITIGRFLTDGLAFGPGITIGYAMDKTTSSTLHRTSNTINVGLNPFMRYYFATGSKIKPYADMHIGFDYSLGNVNETYDNDPMYNTDDSEVNININPGCGAGVAFFLNRVISLECGVSYDYYRRIINVSNGSVDIKANQHHVALGVGFRNFFAKAN